MVCRRELGETTAKQEEARTRKAWLAAFVGASLIACWLAWPSSERPEKKQLAVVLQTNVAMPGSELGPDGKPPTAAPANAPPSPPANAPLQPLEADPKGNPMPYAALGVDNGTKDILRAAELGNGTAVRRLIRDEGVSIDFARPSAPDKTPLVAMIAALHPDLALWTIREGADLERGKPLAAAARYGLSDVVAAMLERGVKPDSQLDESTKATPLLWAASRADTATMKLLIERGADVNAKSARGITPIDYAAHARDGDPAHAVQLLLDHGATASLRALETYNVEVVRYLLLQGVNPDQRYDTQETVLVSATAQACGYHDNSSRARRKMELLLELGADPQPALTWLQKHGQGSECRRSRELVEAAARKPRPAAHEVKDENGNTQLHFAAGTCEVGLVRALIKKGLDVNAMSQGPGDLAHGYPTTSTPLHVAAGMCCPDVAALLVMKGANVNAKDGDNRTPGEVACTKRALGEGMPFDRDKDSAAMRTLFGGAVREL